MLADAREPHALGRQRQPGEDLDDLQLVVEVRLEPERDLFGGGQRLVALAQQLRRGAQELRPQLAQLVVGHVGHRPLVQRVAPRDDRRAPEGAAQLRDGRVTVRDVQHASGARRP